VSDCEDSSSHFLEFQSKLKKKKRKRNSFAERKKFCLKVEILKLENHSRNEENGLVSLILLQPPTGAIFKRILLMLGRFGSIILQKSFEQ